MNICFFGASSTTIDSLYTDAAYELGAAMAQRGHTLVFGAGCNGMMGAVARGVKENGGKIIGITPRFFIEKGVLWDECSELIYTDTMRERKQLMEDMSEAVVMTPGSVGTFEEFFEILTLKQLDKLDKPLVIYNVNNYFAELDAMLRKAISEKFLKEKCLDLYVMANSADEVLDYMESYHGSGASADELR